MSPSPTPILSPIIQTANALSLDAFRALYFPSTISLPLPLPTFSKNHTNNSPSLSPAPSPSLSLSLSLESPSTLPPHDLESCLNLIASTSASAYRASGQGWSPSKKRREMKLGDMKYLLLRGNAPPTPKKLAEGGKDASAAGDDLGTPGPDVQQDSQTPETPETSSSAQTQAQAQVQIQGFLSFLLTHEDNHSVIYIYELHLLPHLRNLGLGSYLMNLVEEIGRGVGVEKAMLTCFLENVAGRRFYEGKLNYGVDEFSPKVEVVQEKRLRGGRVVKGMGKGEGGAGYVILSKRLGLGDCYQEEREGEGGRGKVGGSVGREREREREGLKKKKKKRKRGESG